MIKPLALRLSSFSANLAQLNLRIYRYFYFVAIPPPLFKATAAYSFCALPINLPGYFNKKQH
ncbi:hypothetical protein PPRY_a0860 [Pseudoalteromonas prydzensis ACAM 620]|nr:hypothetical protein [Pseudoalteromonas prydzensis ACAM 620]